MNLSDLQELHVFVLRSDRYFQAAALEYFEDASTFLSEPSLSKQKLFNIFDKIHTFENKIKLPLYFRKTLKSSIHKKKLAVTPLLIPKAPGAWNFQVIKLFRSTNSP